MKSCSALEIAGCVAGFVVGGAARMTVAAGKRCRGDSRGGAAEDRERHEPCCAGCHARDPGCIRCDLSLNGCRQPHCRRTELSDRARKRRHYTLRAGSGRVSLKPAVRSRAARDGLPAPTSADTGSLLACGVSADASPQDLVLRANDAAASSMNLGLDELRVTRRFLLAAGAAALPMRAAGTRVRLGGPIFLRSNFPSTQFER